MIVLANGYGNHSNRLFQNLHFEAFCLKNDIEYYNPTLIDISKYYNSPVLYKKSYMIKFVKSKPINILRKYGLIHNFISFGDVGDVKKEELNILLSGKHKNIYVEGWGFRAFAETEKYHNILSKKYSLKEQYYFNNDMLSTIYKYKEKGYLVVGIHVRRGDYSTFENGAYYFSDEEYQIIINNVHKVISKQYNKKTIFIIFSNDSVTINSDVLYSKNEWYIDHYLMSNCDFLIGPPSTFTLWPSYIGKVPFLHVKKQNQEIRIEDFNVCKG